MILGYIIQNDRIVPKASTLLHYLNDKPQKTILGGLISTVIELYVIFVIFVQMKTLLLNENPYTTSIVKSFTDSHDMVHLNQTSLVTFAFIDY